MIPSSLSTMQPIPARYLLVVEISLQELHYYFDNELIKKYSISTSIQGVGQQANSYQTPAGWHLIRAKIGAGLAANTVFVSRRPTGEIYHSALAKDYPQRDWILTRIMWLSGLEVGKNRLGACDTMRRYVYIHGVPDERKMGVPGSKGCINMTNDDIIELFDQIPCYTRVFIKN